MPKHPHYELLNLLGYGLDKLDKLNELLIN